MKGKIIFWVASLTLLLSACVSNPPNAEQAAMIERVKGRVPAEKLLVVDCLLPPQIRQLGRYTTYAAARRPIKTTALDCEIRGGEYVAYDRANYRTALQAWLPLAEQGDPEAQTYVGEIYEKGLGLPPDYKSAAYWYRQAAAQGFSRAMINLGYLYEKGLGVPKDPKQALNWYRRASGIDDELAYQSELEEQAQQIAEAKTQDLQKIIEQQNRQIQQLKQKLKQQQAQLKQKQAGLKQSQQRLAQLKQQMAQLQNRLPAQAHQQDPQLEQLQAELARLRQAYEKQQMLVAEQQLQVAQLQAQVLKKQQQLAKPQIQIIDPPVLAGTRGTAPQLVVRSNAPVQIIRGRIIAEAGLKQATLNGKPIAVDSQGLFNTALPIADQKTKVVIEATDYQGGSEQFVFHIVPASSAVVQSTDIDASVPSRIAHDIDFGRYYAVVIGNNEYRDFPPLKTAVNDAKNIAQILRDKYGVQTRLLTNADRYTILSALNEVRSQLTEKDNLLIYYAGHGEIDPETEQGYWIPVDADRNNTANWISNAAITDLLNTIKAKHILVIADSCYSGSLSRTSIPRLRTRLKPDKLKKWLNLMARTKSRTVLTSGGLQPVLDSGGGEHSIFARALIDELQKRQGVIDAYRIYVSVSRRVEKEAQKIGFDQKPTYAPIRHAGHGGGEFLLVST